MIFRTLFTAVAGAGFWFSAGAQVPVSTLTQWSHAVVDIHAGDGMAGSGFFIAEKNGLRYIATAEHVVSGRAEVEVRLPFEPEPLTADVVKTNAHYDVAILAVPAAGRAAWQPFPYVADPAVGDVVFLFSGRTGTREVVSRNGTAKITAVDGEGLECNVGVMATNSGTAIFSPRGVVGLALKDPGIGRTATLLKDLVQEWEIPWQLPEADARPQTAAALPPPPPGSIRRRSVPIKGVVIAGELTQSFEASDRDLGTLTNVTKDGILVVILQEVSTFDRIRVYYPADYTVDFPKGHFIIPSDTRQNVHRIGFQAALAPVMQREGTGTWLIFNLGKICTGNEIDLHFRLPKDNHQVPEPFHFYEIAVDGPAGL